MTSRTRTNAPELEGSEDSGSLLSRPDLSRRRLLQGAVAASFAAAFFRGAPARAAGGRPVRFVTMFTPHGAPAEFFWPKSATDYTSTGDVSILKPLEKHAAKINVLRGINYVGSDNHYANKDVLSNRTGTSIDIALAKKLGVKHVRLGVVPDYAGSFTVDGHFCMDGGTPKQAEPDPVKAFTDLAGGLGTAPAPAPGTPAPAPAASPADFRRAASTLWSADLTALKTRAGAYGRLDKHEAALKALAGTAGAPGGTSKPTLTCTKPTLASVEAMRGKNVWDAANFAAVMQAQLDNALFALRCDLTRVVTLQCAYVNNQIPHTFAGVADGHHNVSHGARRPHALCQEWYAKQLAYLLDGLAVPDPLDPTRTILDNSIVLWTSEIGDGQAHTCVSVPMILAGGGGGYLKTGQYLQLSARPHAEVLLAICEAMGATGINVGDNAAGGAMKEVKA